MERPYSGRAKIDSTYRGISIDIPTKKNWFMIIFMAAWLGGWTFGEYFALSTLMGSFGGNGIDNFGYGFLLFWLVGWTVGGIFTIRAWLWMIAGREVIIIENNELTIDRKFEIFYLPKTYNLREIKNFQINPNQDSSNIIGANSNRNIWNMNNGGILKFDYGFKTIKFAAGIDEAEGRYILEKIKEKGYLKE